MTDLIPVDPTMPQRLQIPAADYFALERFSASGGKLIERSPAHFKAEQAAPREPTPAMQMGTLVHAAVLEPDLLPSLYVVMPDEAPDKRTNVGKAWHEAFKADAAGRIVIKADEAARVLAVRDAVRAHPLFAAICNESYTVETTVLWADVETGVLCKSRKDMLSEDCSFIVDVKTTADARPSEFANSAVRYGYDLQAAHYIEGARALSGVSPMFFFLAVETEAPYGVQLMRAGSDFLMRGYHRMRAAMDTYARCVASGEWPCYEPTIHELTLPAWARKMPTLNPIG